MATLNEVSETWRAWSVAYPTSGNTTSLNAAATTDRFKCSWNLANVNAPPMEIKARGNVIRDIKLKVFSTNTGNGVCNVE